MEMVRSVRSYWRESEEVRERETEKRSTTVNNMVPICVLAYSTHWPHQFFRT